MERSMPVRRAEAEWKGSLIEGSGRLVLSSGAFEGPYSLSQELKKANPQPTRKNCSVRRTRAASPWP
jgi:hypothetical protein